jgi:hypothetical protein
VTALNKPSVTYLYCLVHSPKPPSLDRAPRGLPATGKPRLLDAGGALWIVVGDAPLSHYAKEKIDAGLQDLDWVATCAMGHERVIDYCAKAGTVIPMKLFTLFSDDARTTAHIRSKREALDTLIARVAKCREWGVRITLNGSRTTRAARSTNKTKPAEASPGTSFLLQKKREQDLARERKQRAAAQAESAYQKLSKYGPDSLRMPQEEGVGPVVLDAAFLVSLSQEKRFQKEIQQLTSELREYDVTLSGPWPPYNFVKVS